MSLFPEGTREQVLLWSNATLVAILLIWALGSAKMSASEVGLDWRRAPSSALAGAGLGLIALMPPLLFVLLAPLLAGEAIEDPETTARSRRELASFLLFRQPIGTALFEEVAFRGVLYAAWVRAGGDRFAIAASSVVFALWHVVITTKTVAESGVADRLGPVLLGVGVSLLGLFVGGVIFAYLRWHTQSIAAAVVAHWLVVAGMVIAVWAIA
jgi:membrane protease YdiL (CAAX protease family)